MGDINRKIQARRITIPQNTTVKIFDRLVNQNSIMIKILGPGYVLFDGMPDHISVVGYPCGRGEVIHFGIQERSPQDPSHVEINLYAHAKDGDCELALLEEES